MGEPNHDDESVPRFSVHEFLVDFLGALVPGILFLVAVSACLAPPVRAFMISFSPKLEGRSFLDLAQEFLKAASNTPNTIWVGIFIFAVLVSYILGHLFYRRDPKEPNQRSFEFLLARAPSGEKLSKYYDLNEAEFKEKSGRSRREDWLRKNLACIKPDDCEFPYPYLAEYLIERDHKHLVDLVRWKDEKGFRSKTFINRLKIRLQFHHPDKCRQIIRNEAHVRLATSSWYVGRALWKFSLTGLIILFVALLISTARGFFQNFWEPIDWIMPFLVPPVVVLVFAKYCQTTIKKFIHYQRLREAFFVLELAYTAFRNSPEILKSPLSLFKEISGDTTGSMPS